MAKRQMLQSPAYAALTGTARDMLALIERELVRCGGDTVTITLTDFANLGVRLGSTALLGAADQVARLRYGRA